MSTVSDYTNESDGKQKVYVDGVSGPFKILDPGESCQVRLDADQKIKVLDVAPPDEDNEPDPPKAKKAPAGK